MYGILLRSHLVIGTDRNMPRTPNGTYPVAYTVNLTRRAMARLDHVAETRAVPKMAFIRTAIDRLLDETEDVGQDDPAPVGLPPRKPRLPQLSASGRSSR